MSTILFALLALCLLVLTVVYFFKPYEYGSSLRRFKKIAPGDDEAIDSLDTQWRSVRIRPGLSCCKGVESLRDQTFLSREVPSLPLEYCTEETCSCHYLFLDDRRSGLDRRAELAKLRGILPSFERRQSPGRRFGDLAAI